MNGLLFIIVISVAVIFDQVPFWVLILYIGTSLVTFIIYAIDKNAAMKGTWRTKESTLHTLSLFGGWPGAMAAQEKLRHKSVKRPFQIWFWITVILNCLIVSGLIFSGEAARIESFVNKSILP